MQDGWTALIQAARHGHIAAVEWLLSGGADMNIMKPVSDVTRA
jgi:ankyrin repeat protein